MGREARVIAEIGEWTGEGKLQLEMDELQFRGAKRVTVHLPEIESLTIDDGWLVIKANGEESRFDLGDDDAKKWVHAIQNPKTLIDKMDVKATSHVLLTNGFEPEFVDQIEQRAAAVHTTQQQDALYDLVFLRADEPTSLTEIKSLRSAMKSSGAIWVIHMKGRRELSHEAIMDVAKPLGLIDVKSARFSESHACLKLMLPRAAR